MDEPRVLEPTFAPPLPRVEDEPDGAPAAEPTAGFEKEDPAPAEPAPIADAFAPREL